MRWQEGSGNDGSDISAGCAAFQLIVVLLADCDMEIALLTGQTTAAKRREILSQWLTVSCHLLVGTHALLEDRVVFNDLLLTVTDEQHRFGVRQRSKLAKSEQYFR